jgi:hypothetical protein
LSKININTYSVTMKQNLLKAKFALAITKGITTNAEVILAEILDIEDIVKPNSPSALAELITQKTGMSKSLYRKTISELYQNDLLTKKDNLVTVNRKYIVK